ncbi:MAG: copper chaperone PCu(A)C, partial [Gammaproteobacteria bacterium]|nr:copper chaperone PCu(A)C [Gammaproteobacteria bacterium]
MVKQGILVLLVYFVSLSSTAANLEISDAWVRYLPSVIPVRSGYMVIRNKSPQAVSIIKFESEVFTQIDIHETVEKDGMITMR